MLVKCVFDIFVMFLAGIRAPFNASASLPVVFVAAAVVANAVVVGVAATPAAVAVSVSAVADPSINCFCICILHEISQNSVHLLRLLL